MTIGNGMYNSLCIKLRVALRKTTLPCLELYRVLLLAQLMENVLDWNQKFC